MVERRGEGKETEHIQRVAGSGRAQETDRQTGSDGETYSLGKEIEFHRLVGYCW